MFTYKMPLRKIKISNDPLVLSFLRFELGDIMGEKKSKRYRLDKRSKEKMKARMNERVKNTTILVLLAKCYSGKSRGTSCFVCV